MIGSINKFLCDQFIAIYVPTGLSGIATSAVQLLFDTFMIFYNTNPEFVLISHGAELDLRK